MDNYLIIITLAPLLIGWLLDLALGDPAWLPHPVVGFGRLISAGERFLNRGKNRLVFKGGVLAIMLVTLIFSVTYALQLFLSHLFPCLWIFVASLLVFCSLAGTTLIREVRSVYLALNQSISTGRKQLSRIVGRDTEALSEHEIRTAALESLAENLSDGVVAPLFWLAVGGVPAMLAYKMVNTLDSMIAYRTPRFERFGRVAARLDDAANWLPARLTALLMVVVSGRPGLWKFVRKHGSAHSSPNSGWPEAALAGILDCRFGGPHDYFGTMVWKPYIGTHARELTTRDMERAVAINRRVEVLAVVLVAVVISLKIRLL